MKARLLPDGPSPGSMYPVLVPVESTRPVIVTIWALQVVLIDFTNAIRVVEAIHVATGVLSIRLIVPLLEPPAIVNAAELVANRAGRIVSETRLGVPLASDPPVIVASVFELPPAAFYPRVAGE